ncbi:MAG: hypothetical protein K2H81_00590 [Alistipes sp.]|nr:hypothetical protein [Alistipes sp.]
MIKRIVGILLAAASLAVIVLTALRYGSHTSLISRTAAEPQRTETTPPPAARPQPRAAETRQSTQQHQTQQEGPIDREQTSEAE